MTKHKPRGYMNHEIVISAFKNKGFKIINYIYINDGIVYYVSKDYSKKFNIDFDGNIVLEAKVNFNIFKQLMICYYPDFKEISNIIPKIADNHIYSNGNMCYAPPYRPLHNKWKISDFINAVDSMINNYFSKEYIGIGFLTELEHGNQGLKQYNELVDNK